MTNLFQQQAELDRQAARSPVISACDFIRTASLEHCQMIAQELSNRLFALEKQHADMAASNLEEAARYAMYSAIDIGGAIRINKGE